MVTYADRPWTKHYDYGVPATIQYPEVPLHQYLTDTAQKTPDRVALISPAHVPVLGHQALTMTYRELDQASDALAAGLINLGLKKGDRVAIVLPNSVAFAISFFGILKAGGVVAATNPTYPPPKMQYQINDCDAEFVIALTPFYKLVKQIQPGTKVKTVIVTNIKEYFPASARLLFTLAKEKQTGHRLEELTSGDYWFQDVLKRYAGQKPQVDVKPADRAALQYTGGTTGISKGAVLTHKSLVANMLQLEGWTKIFETDHSPYGILDPGDFVYLGAIPMFHIYGLLVLLSRAISSGSKIVLVANARDVDTLVEIINHYRPNVFLGVPAMFNSVVNHPRIKSGEVHLDSFIISSSGAAPLPPATKREYETAGAKRLNEGYGMSETSAVSHSNPLVGENKPGTVGMPLPDMDIRVVSLDDGVTDVPVGEIGEIVMSGPNIMAGYHGMPTETTNVLREQNGKIWLFSGDIGRMDEDGYFTIVDRKKDMALIGGFNVYPNNIEKVLKDHPAVLEVGVAAIPHPDKPGEEALKAWIVLKPGQQATEQEMIDYCSKFLAGYEVPRRFAFIQELPKTMVGKTLRRELIQMEMEAREKELQSS